MYSHRALCQALCQALCVLLCLASYTAGSDIVFTSSPSTIQNLVTENLTLRCSLQDSPTSGTSGLVGKRHTFSDVTSRSATSSDIKFVNSISITKNGVDVATVSVHAPATIADNTTGVHVTGQVPGSGAEKGSLQVDWKYPSPDQTGTYQCVITGIDQSGHTQTFQKDVDVTQNELSVEDLIVYIHQLKMTNDLLTATIANNTQEFKDLRKVVTDQTAAITALTQRQDTRVLFTAGLDHQATVPLNGVVVFNNLTASVGGGFSTSTGVFTCPVDGYYMFHVHVMNQREKVAEFCLRHNDNCVNSFLADSGFDYQTGSSTASLLLRKGDTVKVTAIYQTAFIHGNRYLFSTLSGQLVALL